MLTKSFIEKYFNAEKDTSMFFLITAIILIGTAFILYFGLKGNFYRGVALAFGVFSILFSIAGLRVYTRSDMARIQNMYDYDRHPSELKNRELPRMKIVMKKFRIYRCAGYCLMLAGAGLFIFFIRDFKNDFWRGFGLSLFIMTIIAQLAVYFAAKRGKDYTRQLEDFTAFR
jgi:hypothetical protein